MPICPSCCWENPDGTVICEHCSSGVSQGSSDDSQTVLEVQPTLPHLGAPRPWHLSAELRVGELVAKRYEVLEAIGRGGMGCVYRVLDRHLDRVIALKTITPQLSAKSDALRRFKQEILAARQVSHKNVIRIFDFGLDGDLAFITMEYFEGEDLHSRLLKQGKFSPIEAVPIMRQICQGLSSAHAEGITHRDLKPQNILINRANEIRILDFGLARLQEAAEASTTGAIAGTPDYMSPEQVKGERVDSRSDLFSAGIVFYEMLTGELPFGGESVIARLLARTEQRARPLSGSHPEIPLALSGIVARCLERDVAKRYPSAGAVLQALDPINSLAPQPGKPGRPFRLASGKKGRYGIAAGLALLATMTIASLLLRHPEKGQKQAPTAAAATESYIAVLPLKTSGSRDLKHAAEGIRESLWSRLAAVSSLHAVAPSAVDKADLKLPESQLAQQLGANVLVQGTFAETNGLIEVQLSLYDVRKEAVTWTANASGAHAELLALLDELSSKLFEALHVSPARNVAAEPPTHNMEAYDLYLQGRELLKTHRGDAAAAKEALNLFKRAVTADGSFALAWTGVADASLELYRINHDILDADRAQDAARRASRISSLPEVHLAAGSVYTQIGKHHEAIAEIRQALAVEPNSDDAYVRLGRTYLETGQTNLALSAFQRAVKLNPFYWYNHDQLARAFFRVGRDNDALGEFKKVADVAPDNPGAHLGIASVLVRQGKWAESIPEYQKSLALKPSAVAYTSLGAALFYLKRYPDAVVNFEKAVQLDPRNPTTLGNLGAAYRQMGRKQKASDAFTRAIEAAYRRLQLNPQDAMTLGSAALFHAYNGQSEEALALIARARNIDPASNELMYNEAVVRALAGPSQIPAALSALKAAILNGYSLDEARRDPDLKALQNYPEFKALSAVSVQR